MTRSISMVALAAMAAALVAGCSATGTQGVDAAPTTTVAAGLTPSPTPVSEESIGEASAVIADGRHPVILKSVDAAKLQVTFDLVVFLTGDAADAEYRKRYPGGEDEVPNDYFIVNDNPKLRTVTVASGAQIKLLPQDGTIELVPATLAELAANAADRLCWITVTGGSIVLIEEQFVP